MVAHLCTCVFVLYLFALVKTQTGYYQLNVVGKETMQSTTAVGGVSSRAVDGNSNNKYFNGSCTHTKVDDHPAWWAVDLGSQYRVHSVGIVNRGDCCGDWLNHFTILGYNEGFDPEDNTNNVTCYTYSGEFGNGETQTFECDSLMDVKFVGIQLNRDKPLTLCEVYVYVECDPGEYGENCKFKCSNNCKNPACNAINGSCSDTGCNPGFKGDNCTTECYPGEYGENCKFKCSSNCKNPACNAKYGSCSDAGCNPGFKGDNCTTECFPGEYGENCKLQCPDHCKSPACNPINGSCSDAGCNPGFKGDNCTTECSSGEYGENCKLKCSDNCKDPACNSIDGSCSDNGCKPGFEGDNCTTECCMGSNIGLSQSTSATGIPVVTFAVAVAVLSLLCLALSAFIIVGKVKTMRARKKCVNGNQDTTYVVHTYENDLIAATGQGVVSAVPKNTDAIAESKVSDETYERINNRERNMNDNHAKTYQELKV